MSEILCPCGSGAAYALCCAPYHEGTALPDSGEAVVRSRFTAFCMEKYEYLVETTHPDFRDDLTIESVRENTKGVTWQSLEIRECGTQVAPQPKGDEGAQEFETVTFSALYEREGRTYQMVETSYFTRQDGKLYYVEGMAHRPLGYRRPEPKVGRNEPCPCGSGKKYKKCCALKEDAAQ